MKQQRNRWLLTVASVAAFYQGGAAQAPPEILKIDTENFVSYAFDETDRTKFTTNPELTKPVPAVNFGTFIFIADIVAVKPV